jgi:hypothetical protein
MAWFRPYFLQGYCDRGLPADGAHGFAHAFAGTAGSETYFFAACVSHNVALQTKGRLPSLAAFVASALDLLAIQPREPPVIKGKVEAAACSQEIALATSVRHFFQNKMLRSLMEDVAGAKLLTDAWQRVECSGVLERRLLGLASLPDDPSQSVSVGLEAAAAEGAAHGLHTCALAGCTANKAHVSQFKKCGACRTVAYCCKEHQVADWPAHKAACKAARKAAAPEDDDS